ncbi:hypothetical protein ACFV9E_20575, partial [Streptomyces sp. NPDC059835]|uniref:hypothetical protein n=1 Tax=Streptomyces sp. NPDC059835 TaxID=3346967 RepID=UPI003646F279
MKGTYRAGATRGVAAVLRHLMARSNGSDLRFRVHGGKIRHHGDHNVDAVTATMRTGRRNDEKGTGSAEAMP